MPLQEPDPIAAKYGGVAVADDSDPVASKYGGVLVAEAPIQRPPVMEAHGITDPASVKVTEPVPPAVVPAADQRGYFNPKTGTWTNPPPAGQGVLDAPIQGVPQLLGGLRRGILPDQPTVQSGEPHVVQGTQAADKAEMGAVSDILEGAFKTAQPLLIGTAVVDPVGTALGVLKATVAAKVGQKASEFIGTSPEAAKLAGDLAAALSAGVSVRGFLRKNLADAASVLGQAKAFDVANPPEPAPGVKAAGRGATEAAIQQKPALQAENEPLPPSDTEVQEPPPQPPAAPAPVAPPERAPIDRVLSDLTEARRTENTAAERTAIAELTARGVDVPARDAVAEKYGGVPVSGVNASVSTEKAPSTPVQPTAATTAAIKNIEAKAQEPNKFSSTQVDLPPAVSDKVKAVAATIPDEDLAENGRETEPHVTVKYGLHTDDVAEVRKVLAQEPPITVKLGALSTFPDSGNGEVVKADVDSSELHRLNQKIADALPTTDTHPTYSPHVTLAYVKPGAGQKYVGRDDLKGQTATIDAVTFSPKDGEPVTIPLTGKPVPTSGQESATLPEAQPREEGGRPESRAGTSEPGPLPQGGNPPRDAAAERAALRQRTRERKAEYASAVAAAPTEVVNDLISQAQKGGYHGDPEVLRTELQHRLALIKELDDEFESSGHNPKAILSAIAGYGGISIKKETALKSELKDLAQLGIHGTSGKGAPFGQLGGVNAVFNQHGKSLDDMLASLRQEPRFQHLERLQDLHAAIYDAATAEPEGLAADRLKEGLGAKWWEKIKPVVSHSFEEDLAELRGEDEGDTSFDTSAFEPDEDVLDTGERQARLPEAGAVREREVKTPNVAEAPFSLASEASGRKSVEPSLFGDERPKFSKREPAPVFYSALTRAAEGLKQERGTPEQMGAMLQKAPGVKKEELDWSGVVPWLQGQGRFVTKADIVDYLKKNELQVSEVEKGSVNKDAVEARTAAGDRVARARTAMNGPGVSYANVADAMGGEEHGVRAFLHAKATSISDGASPSILDSVPGLTDDQRAAIIEYAEALKESKRLSAEAVREAKPTKFSQYTLPGAENYRELLITLPNQSKAELLYPEPLTALPEGWEPIHDSHQPNQPWGVTPAGQLHARSYRDYNYETKEKAIAGTIRLLNEERNEQAAEEYRRQTEADQFGGGHFDEPNVVAHIRVSDRTDDQNRRVLFVEEVQSDWHQKGRKQGYRPKFDPNKLDALTEVQTKARDQANKASQYVRELLDQADNLGYDTASEAMRDLRAAGPDWRERWDVDSTPNATELIPAIEEMRTAWTVYGTANDALSRYRDEERQPPDAPFKTTWPELAMKRALRYAADHDYEVVGWTTGDQQAERYDLSKQISSIKGYRNTDGTYWLKASRKGYPENDDIIAKQDLSESDITDLIGKDAADKLLEKIQENEHLPSDRVKKAFIRLEGLDLKVGGSGMRGFYDAILPTFLKKYLKPFGAVPKETAIRTAHDYDIQHDRATDTYVIWDPKAHRTLRRGNDETIKFDDRAEAVAWLRNYTKENTLAIHAVDLTDQMREHLLQGQPLFAKPDEGRPSGPQVLAQAKAQAALMKSTYEGIASVPMSGRAKPVAILDAGGRLTAKELASITKNPAVQRLSVASLKVLDELMGHMLGEAKDGVEQTGIVFDDRTYGVYVPKPGESRGPQKKASIFLGILEAMLPGATPEKAAATLFQTVVHEVLHWYVPMDGPEFERELLKALTKIGPAYQAHATKRMMDAYADVDDPARYREGLREALSLYSESRRRPEVTPDALSRSGRRSERSPDEQNAGDKPPPDLRRGRGKVVTRAELRELARRRNTSLSHERERAIEAGYAIQDEGILAPTVEKITGGVAKDRELALSLLAPQKIGVAPIAAGKIRAHTAANDQRKARVAKVLAADRRIMDAWSEAESAKFIDVMEGAAPVESLPAEQQPIARRYRQILNGWTKILSDHDLLRSYIDHYWPHEWKQRSMEGKAIRKFLGRRPVQGTESFRKQRTIPTFKQGVAFGLKPVTWNPAEMLQRKVFEMSQSVKGRALHRDFVESGLYAYLPAGKEKPEAISDWARVPDYALGTKYAPPQEGQPGRTILGYYYAPREVVRLIENHLSPGLWGKSALYDAYKTMGNLSTQFILGWSSFHLWLTGLESTISKASVALEHASRGEMMNALKVGAQIGPQGIVRDLFRGYKAIKEFYSRDGDANDVTGIIGQIIQAGGGFGWSAFEHEDAPAKFMKDLRGLLGALQRGEVGTAAGKAGKAVVHGALAAFEAPTSLIMNHWVPYLKVSAFLDMAQLEMTRLGPEATLDEYREVLGKAWDAVDDRFGQLRYDNLFWNNTFKQLATGGLLSVGWQVGSLRHGLGVLGQGKRVVENVKARMEGGSGGGKPPKGPSGLSHRSDWFGPEGRPGESRRVVQPGLQRNAAWLFTGAVIVGLLGAIDQKLKTGKNPESIKDLFYPRNGKIDANGREERESVISYAKDYYAWIKHPITTFEHKLKPFLEMMWETARNEDFFGTEIRNEDDPVTQQTRDVVLYWLQRNLPISYGNAKRLADDPSDGWEVFRTWAGLALSPFTPAPAELERSAAENYLHDLMPPQHRTKEEAEKGAARRALREGLSEKNPQAMGEAAKAGLSEASRRAVARTQRMGPLASAFERATWPQAVKAYDLATPDERQRLKPLLLSKFGNALGKAGSQSARQGIISQRNAAMKQPTANVQ